MTHSPEVSAEFGGDFWTVCHRLKATQPLDKYSTGHTLAADDVTTARQRRRQVKNVGVDTYGERAECRPIMGICGRSPWLGGYG